MIRATELRIGNRLIKDGIIVAIDARAIFDIWDRTDKYSPISLSIEIFEKCGFEKIKGYLVERTMSDCNIVSLKVADSFNISVTGPFGMVAIKDISYLHELQNLYFALAGAELALDATKLSKENITHG